MSKLLNTLAKLSGSDKFVFAAFHERDKSLPSRQLYGTFKEHKESLQMLNEKGYGIYVTINHPRGATRTNDEIVQCRAIFQDDDKQFKGTYPLPPSLIIQSSKDKFQRYWFITSDTAPLVDEWSEVQANMELYGNDKSCKDAARVFRIPGFKNMKLNESNGGAPFEVTEHSAFKSIMTYEWNELVTAFGKKVKKKERTVDLGTEDNELDLALKAIISGENFNNSLCTVSMHLANKGYSPLLIEATLKGAMQQCETRDKRWQDRMDHMPRLIKTALDKAGDENVHIELDNLQQDIIGVKIKLPWPPGYLGVLAECVYNYQHYQDRTLAIITALGIAAGLTGRKYNISGMGLNLYMTILMDSGRGKDSIQSFASKFYLHYNELGNAFNFLGPKRFTGPKGLYAKIREQRSMLCVFTEAAFMLNSTAGDQAGLTRAMLDIYTKSGHGNYVAAEQYSKTEDSVAPMHSPSLTIINESTAEGFIEYMRKKQLEETGELGRMNIFRITEEKPYENRNPAFEIPSDLETAFKKLVLECASSAYEETPDVISLDRPHEYYAFSDWCVDREKYYHADDRVQSMLYSRMAVKAMKFAALCAILMPRDPDELPIIDTVSWNWAVEMVKTEVLNIQGLYSHTGSSDLDDIAELVIKPCLIKLFKGQYKGKNQTLSKDKRDAGIFSYSVLHQVTKNNSQLKRLAEDHSGMTPLAKILRHLESVGLVRKLLDRTEREKEDKRKSSAYYRLTKEGLKLWLEN